MTPPAYDGLEQTPPTTRGRLWRRIKALRENPRPHNSWPLSGAWAGLRKIRVGDYRIIYGIDDKTRLVRVVRVGHRHNVYD